MSEPAAVYVAVDELTPWADNPRVNAGYAIIRQG